jgi:hypothetical protein
VQLVRSIEVRTDASGRWSVPSEHEWTVGILAADGLPLYANVYCILAEGFRKEAWTAHKGWLPRSSAVDDGSGDEKTAEVRLVRSVNRAILSSEQNGSMTTCGVAVKGEGAVQQAVAADGASPRR